MWALEKNDAEVDSYQRTILENLQRKHLLDYPYQNTPPFYAALAMTQIIAQVEKIFDSSV